MAYKNTNKKKTRLVKNIGGHRVELVIGGRVYVFLPNKSVEVPYYSDIPEGLGLVEKK